MQLKRLFSVVVTRVINVVVFLSSGFGSFAVYEMSHHVLLQSENKVSFHCFICEFVLQLVSDARRDHMRYLCS